MSSQSRFNKLRSLGHSGHSQDMLLPYYKSKGATSNNLVEAESQFLSIKGFNSGSLIDRWNAYLSSLGFTGDLQSKRKAFWESISSN